MKSQGENKVVKSHVLYILPHFKKYKKKKMEKRLQMSESKWLSRWYSIIQE